MKCGKGGSYRRLSLHCSLVLTQERGPPAGLTLSVAPRIEEPGLELPAGRFQPRERRPSSGKGLLLLEPRLLLEPLRRGPWTA